MYLCITSDIRQAWRSTSETLPVGWEDAWNKNTMQTLGQSDVLGGIKASDQADIHRGQVIILSCIHITFSYIHWPPSWLSESLLDGRVPGDQKKHHHLK